MPRTAATPDRADPHPLDNPVWHALRGPHSRLAQWSDCGRAARYDPEACLFAGVDRLDEKAWAAQASLAGDGGMTLLFRDEVPPPPPGWREVYRAPGWQLVASDLGGAPEVAAEPLGTADVAAMLDLTRRTEPGPFLARTVELGTYVGVKEEGRLVAMAGERMRLDGFTEISAVCTDPCARRRGYGAALTLRMARHIRERGDEAFLHVLETNENALRLYEALGFRRRRRVHVVAAVRTGQGIR